MAAALWRLQKALARAFRLLPPVEVQTGKVLTLMRSTKRHEIRSYIFRGQTGGTDVEECCVGLCCDGFGLGKETSVIICSETRLSAVFLFQKL